MQRPLQLLLTVLFFVCALEACSLPDQDGSPLKKTPGVTETEVFFGSSLALSGHASYLGIQTLRGTMSYIKHINETGGVHGRTIKIIFYDDSYDPPKCLANTQKLIIEDRVFSLCCYVGTPTIVKILPLLEEAKIPFLGMFTGANALREPFNRYLINVRASYYQETGAAVMHLVEDLNIEKIAILYQYDAYGFDGLSGAELGLKRYDLVPVAGGSYIRGTLDVEEGLNKIINSGAEAVVLIGTYEPCARFIKLAGERGFTPVFYTPSFAGAEELARRLDSFNNIILIMSQVVPPPEGPESEDLLGGAVEYIQLLKQYYPEDTPNFVGLESYVNAKVLVEGLKSVGRDLTREKFIDAIESIRDFSLGPDITISFSPTDHQGMDRVYFTRLENGRFTLIDDWTAIKKAFIDRNEVRKKNYKK